MTFNKVRAENLLASLVWMMMTGVAVSSCGLRAVAPTNAPPIVAGRWQPADDEPAHQGIAIDGRGYVDHEILAPSDGVVARIRGDYVRIRHGLDSNGQDIHTEHFHLYGISLKEGDQVNRGQNIGLLGKGGKYTLIPHYHYVVRKREGPGKFVVLDPIDYWFGIDEYKENLEKGRDSGPFVILCFDPNVKYPKEPIRFTYPVKCK